MDVYVRYTGALIARTVEMDGFPIAVDLDDAGNVVGFEMLEAEAVEVNGVLLTDDDEDGIAVGGSAPVR